MDDDEEIARIKELMKPIDMSIQLCDDEKDLLTIACAMMQRTDELFCKYLGKEGRTKMFLGVINDRKN